MTHTVHVVAFESPGSSGGFEWRTTDDEAQQVEATVLGWPSVQDGSCAVARFAVEVPADLSRDETTAHIDARFYAGEYDEQLWPLGYPDPKPRKS